MKRLTCALTVILCSSATVAQTRLLTSTLPCSRASALVAEAGSIVMNTTPTTYDRFVRNSSFCAVSETGIPAIVRSADNPHCQIGFRCGGVSKGGGGS